MAVSERIKIWTDLFSTQFERMQALAFHLPFVRVNRHEFLLRNLRGVCTDEERVKCLEKSPAQVLPKETVHKIAYRCIMRHALLTAVLSALSALPSNYVILFIALVCDLIQFQLLVFILAQKLYYLYRHDNLHTADADMKANVAKVINMASAIMIGAHRLSQTMKSASGVLAKQAVIRFSEYRGGRVILTNIIRQVCKWLGVQSTRTFMTLVIEYTVVAICAIISGLISFWLMWPMGKRLVAHLEKENQEEDTE